ncbi:Crp/Fnr family transcriptional regulator [Spirulina sp. CS-785/01]|uniref:Crp/Fnr family transcriptional regulator n=1 Tax=Spirulina sp. CS-785/01 TaxID=3021716 RepID=UPI00232B40C4|nr:Crp/Fnr family transcriptional regulator [Spirulina sp. CS-785/01]MDB9314407.1 Crp/Fnr family transcriptional regulator [Spirulina sp. CS-785/01]
MLLTSQPPSPMPHGDPHEGRRLHLYHRGDTIPLETQGVWQVYRGLVQLSTTHASGEEVMLGWVLPSSYFGQWLSNLEVYEAKALSEVYLRWFFLREIEKSPSLAQSMLSSVSHRLRQSEAMLAIAGQRRVEDRLNQLLALLKEEIGQPTETGTRLSVRLTHQTLANAIGTTRVTITRLLGKLQRCGQIHLDRDRHIIIRETFSANPW